MESSDRDIDAIFLELVELPESERAAHIERACAGDASKRREVEALLATYEQVDDVLPKLDFAEPPPPQDLTGTTFGGYAIHRMIAEGGMGVVYEAEQAQPHRRVALKVIRPEAMTAAMLQRFEFEVETLGQLDHPGIARIFEAGTHDVGHGAMPYFAMEFVDGVSLLEYCDREDLDVRARLALLAAIGDAVQHAHQRGVIHRDLKPANILVTKDGQPKILDFGVARATQSESRITAVVDDMRPLIGTLPYMSPEQASGDVATLDTRSDVYALGVVGYEMLVGRLPYSIESRVLHEVVRVICEQPPTRLSSIRTSYRGDVETIIGKALEKDRTRRYESVSDLVSDIRRHLSHVPITARPPSFGYQLSRFVQRHKIACAAAALVVVSLVVGIVMTTAARTTAERERNRAESVMAYLSDELLAPLRPEETGGRETTLFEVLEATPDDLGGHFDDDPLAAAIAHEAMGRSYQSIGRAEEAIQAFERALDLRGGALDDEDPILEATRFEVAVAMGMIDDRRDEAREQLLYLANRRMERYGLADRATFDAMHELGVLLVRLGEHERAASYFDGVVMHGTVALGPMHVDVLRAKSWLGRAYFDTSDLETARPYLEEASDGLRATLGEGHATTLTAMNNLARLERVEKRYDEAETLFRIVYDKRVETLGPTHALTFRTLNDLAAVYRYQERLDDVVEVLDGALVHYEQAWAETASPVSFLQNNLAAIAKDRGELERAASLQEQALDIRIRTLGEGNVRTVVSKSNLAHTLHLLGDHERALVLAGQALAVANGDDAVRRLLRDHRYAAILRNNALALDGLGRSDEAIPLLREAYGVVRDGIGPEAERVRDSIKTLLASAGIDLSAGDAP